MGEHTWSFPSSGRLRGVRVWVKWNFVNVERRVVQQACIWVAFKSSSLESEAIAFFPCCEIGPVAGVSVSSVQGLGFRLPLMISSAGAAGRPAP